MRQVSLILVAALIASSAQAAPSDELEQARAVYRTGQYQKALPIFNALLYPQAQLAGEDDLSDAYLALGVCRFETGDATGARREFKQALALNARLTLDPLIVTDRDAIKAFNETKNALKQQIEEDALRKRQADYKKLRDSIIGFESHPLYLNFVPFGTGQFQNNDTARGVFFATTEGAALITSVSIWGYLVNKYGVRSTHVPLDDGPNVRFLQQIEIGSGVLFLGLWVYGAIDSYRHYKPQTRAAIDEDLLPKELRDLDRKKRPATPTSLLDHLSPMLTPNGAGIGLAWEN